MEILQRFLISTLSMATPLFITALGGIFSERCGVINIALEGMMLVGAFFGVVGSHFSGSPWIGLLIGIAGAGVFSLIHAVVSVRFQANQVVSGVALNLLASGLTVFLLEMVFGVKGTSANVPTIPSCSALLGLTDRDSALFRVLDFPPLILFGILLVGVAQVVLYRTVFGLRLRAVGEHAQAAGTLGVPVDRLRFAGVFLSGLLAGLAGAYLSLSLVGAFRKDMSAGRGYIALAAMITGKWNPVGAFLASLFFGAAQALEFFITDPVILGVRIPTQVVQMAPYLLTLVILAGFIGRSEAPGDLGKPHRQGEKH